MSLIQKTPEGLPPYFRYTQTITPRAQLARIAMGTQFAAWQAAGQQSHLKHFAINPNDSGETHPAAAIMGSRQIQAPDGLGNNGQLLTDSPYAEKSALAGLPPLGRGNVERQGGDIV